MPQDIEIKELQSRQFDEAFELVWRVFTEFEAPEYSAEGIDEFYRSIHDESFLSMLKMYGAYAGGTLLGVIATRSEGRHIALFFVDGGHHRQGIGRLLFEAVLPADGRLTVNSSPYAVPVYRRLGFRETDAEQTVNGVRFTPMELECKAK